MLQLRNWLSNRYSRITDSIAFLPSLLTVSFMVLALGLLVAENYGISQYFRERVPLLIVSNESTGRAILTTLIGGLMGLMVFSFSMVMVLLNQAASQFSPRLLPGLVSQRQNQVVLGVYIGTICYCLLTLMNVQPKVGSYTIPSVTIVIGVVLGILCLALFVYFINGISRGVQVEDVLSNIYRDTAARLNYLRDDEIRQHTEDLRDVSGWQTINARSTGYYQGIQQKQLIKLAKKHRTAFKVLVPIGTFVLDNVPLIKSRRRLPREALDDLGSCIHYANEEHIHNSYVFGVKQITEVALKAMSPGINDPGTCLTCIDYLTELFALRMDLDDVGYAADEEGVPRVYFTPVSFDDLIYFVMAELRTYCKQDPAVVHQLLRMFRYLLLRDDEKQRFYEILTREVNTLMADVADSIINQRDRERLNALAAGLDELQPTVRQVQEIEIENANP